jgi:DNA polymerase III subunit gamma/tau
MLMVRLAYASDLPTPDEALKMLKDGGGTISAGAPAPSPRGGGGAMAQAMARPVVAAANPAPRQLAAPAAAPRMRIDSLQQLVALAHEKRDILTATALRSDIRLVRLEDGVLEFGLTGGADPAIVQRLGLKLMDWTGRRWMVSVSNEPGDPTISEMEDARQAEEASQRHAHPVVQAILARWPGAKVLPPPRKPELMPSAAERASAPVVDEDGDVVAGEVTEDDL